MIPILLYQDKIGDLRDVLTDMGADPRALTEWLFEERHQGGVRLAKAQSSAAASLALVSSMPRFSGVSVLGLKLTEPKQAEKRQAILERNQNQLYEEISDLEAIQASLHDVLGMVTHRLYLVKHVKDHLAEQAHVTGRGSDPEGHINHLERNVLPLLTRLQTEIQKALGSCAKEIKSRRDEIEKIDKRQLSVPKYSRKVRKRRLARVKAKAAAEAAAKAAQEADKKTEKSGDSD
jgi:chromosome segregation ATPase